MAAVDSQALVKKRVPDALGGRVWGPKGGGGGKRERSGWSWNTGGPRNDALESRGRPAVCFVHLDVL